MESINIHLSLSEARMLRFYLATCELHIEDWDCRNPVAERAAQNFPTDRLANRARLSVIEKLYEKTKNFSLTQVVEDF